MRKTDDIFFVVLVSVVCLGFASLWKVLTCSFLKGFIQTKRVSFTVSGFRIIFGILYEYSSSIICIEILYSMYDNSVCLSRQERGETNMIPCFLQYSHAVEAQSVVFPRLHRNANDWGLENDDWGYENGSRLEWKPALARHAPRAGITLNGVAIDWTHEPSL